MWNRNQLQIRCPPNRSWSYRDLYRGSGEKKGPGHRQRYGIVTLIAKADGGVTNDISCLGGEDVLTCTKTDRRGSHVAGEGQRVVAAATINCASREDGSRLDPDGIVPPSRGFAARSPPITMELALVNSTEIECCLYHQRLKKGTSDGCSRERSLSDPGR